MEKECRQVDTSHCESDSRSTTRSKRRLIDRSAVRSDIIRLRCTIQWKKVEIEPETGGARCCKEDAAERGKCNPQFAGKV